MVGLFAAVEREHGLVGAVAAPAAMATSGLVAGVAGEGSLTAA
jgi:hypothetical protein